MAKIVTKLNVEYLNNATTKHIQSAYKTFRECYDLAVSRGDKYVYTKNQKMKMTLANAKNCMKQMRDELKNRKNECKQKVSQNDEKIVDKNQNTDYICNTNETKTTNKKVIL